MPQQLIYTSAPRGLVAGRSGHCTVARSASMREALVLQLEKFCYYQHLSLSGGRERPIFACRVVDIRGSRFHVLSRIQDAGLDFTGRTNFIAHHLVFSPVEIRQFALPPVILRDWPGWIKSWTNEPQLFQSETWNELTALASASNVPAQTWRRVTGDAVNGYGLLEARTGASFRVDDQPDETVLALFAESLELLELRDPRKDFRVTAWQYTFTTSIQEQDNPADFRWRCLHSDNPAAGRFATPDCRALSAVRAAKSTAEETALARSGRQAPKFVVEPQDGQIIEGGNARFQAKAEGVPDPNYQWFAVDRTGNGQMMTGETSPELVVANPPLGVSRYVARASNSAGDATSHPATLSVEPKLRLAQSGLSLTLGDRAGAGIGHMKSEEDIESQRLRLLRQEENGKTRRRQRYGKIFALLGSASLFAVASMCARQKLAFKIREEKPTAEAREANYSSNPPTLIPSGGSVPSIHEAARTRKTVPPVQADANTNEVLNGNLLQDQQFRLPHGWARTLIGNVSNANAEFVPKRFDLSANGAGFFEAGDSVLFAYATNMASAIAATLVSCEPALTTSRCGIMVRESVKTNASFLFIGASSEKVYVYSRDDEGKFNFSERSIPKPRQKKKLYLRLAINDRVFPSYAFVPEEWTMLDDTNTIPARGNLFAGMAICSGSASNKVVAHFESVVQTTKP